MERAPAGLAPMKSASPWAGMGTLGVGYSSPIARSQAAVASSS